MLLKLDVLASTTIKRKKPWPKLAWLGKDVGDLFLFDSHRISQLYLPSGKTKKKIPLLQSYLEDVQGFGISSNGLFVAGALSSGRIFIWNKHSATIKLTAVLDKIRNVQPGTRHTGVLQLYISDCGSKVLLLSGFRQVFLWETQRVNRTINTVGDSLKGVWLQIQCGTYVLPDEKDKETAIHGVFFVDPVCGTSCSLSWVFNKGDRIHVTALHLLWPGKNYNFQVVNSNNQIEEGLESSFTPTWRTFKHSLYNLTPAERVIKLRKGYVARVSPDGQVMVIAMNQKLAAHNRVMFYSLSKSAVAVIADLKGCGAKMNMSGSAPNGRSWWVADMAWTRDSLLVLCITRRGSVCILTKLGEPLEICTEGCSLHTGPALFLPLHPKITFQKSHDAFPADSSESRASEKDPLCQRFSVSVHPYLPVVLSSDGYLVTLMQLPPVASYHGVMTGFMRDVTRLVPEVDVEIQSGILSRVSSLSRINILTSEANISRGVTSTEFLSDAPSENNSTGSSTVVPGYGLASGDQGVSFFGLNDPEVESSLPEYTPGSLESISHAQSLSIVALALGSACGVNWKREVGPAMDLTVKVVIKVFQFLLRSTENNGQPHSYNKALSSSVGDLTKGRSPSPVADSHLSRALVYFHMLLEVFQWDSCHRNVFAWAFHLTHGIVREILLLRDLGVVYRVTCCIRVLKLAERVLNLVYSSKSEQMPNEHSSKPPLGTLVKRESVQVRQDAEQVTQESEEDKPQSEHLQPKSDLVKPDYELVKQDFEPAKHVSEQAEQESNRRRKDDDSEKEVSENPQTEQQTVAQTHLSGSWLLLYNFTSQSCMKMQKRRTSLFSVQEGENRGSVEKKMVALLCDIQEKLQMLGVRIPTNAGTAKENIQDISAYLAGTYYSLPPEKPQESLFSRRRSSLQETAGRGQSPDTSRRYGLPFRGSIESQQSRDISSRLSLEGIPLGSVNEQDSKTLLSILYLHLQQYDLRSALDLVCSLIEPQFSCEQFESYGNFSLLSNTQSAFQGGSHPPSANQRMDVLLQNYPITRVADKRGLKVVQTLARFMSAYFSNLSLYVFPSYLSSALPPFHDHKQRITTSAGADQQGPSQVIEHVLLDRAKVGQAVRDQGLYDLWSANTTVELLLVSGLILEAAWLARNLGDWKNTMLLSFASDVLTSRFSDIATDPQIQLMFPAPLNDIKPSAIALSRLNPTFKQKCHTEEEKKASFGVDMLDHSATAKKSQRTQQSGVDIGTEMDGKVVKEVSRILEAGLVAGLDLVPLILASLLVQLKEVVCSFVWLVPEQFYLPYPPSYCPQPTNLKKGTTSPAAETEEHLRTEVAGIVQRIFLLLNASNCLAPCVRWYIEQLVHTTESWYTVDRSDSGFPVPSSLAGYADRGFSFHDKRGHVSPKKKAKRSSEAPASGKEEKRVEKLSSSITSVLSGFRDFCAIMWLMHVRDKMSKASRKYRQLRSQSTGSEEEATTIQSICWETLLWTARLATFSSLLDATDKIHDTLLTLLSELPPTVATAELTAKFFNDPEVVQTTSGRAKFKRLMAQFRGVTVQDGEQQEEPLSVLYRIKCMDWEEELCEREKLFGNVCDQFFAVPDVNESVSTKVRPTDETASNDGATFGRDASAVTSHGDQAIAVGTASFETEPSYFQFLDTFFMITVSKTIMEHHSKAPYPIPLLSPYSKQLVAADKNSLVALQRKSPSETPAKPIKNSSSLFRSQSFTDVRSSRPNQEASTQSSWAGVDIKRSSSMNDVAKLGSLPGLQTLGNQILDFLPSLTWLSRWTLEGSSLPSSNFNHSTRGAKVSLPVMRVCVPLPLLVNGLWLLQNVYWPWISNAEVLVDIKINRQLLPQRHLSYASKEVSSSVKDASTPPKALREVLSDSNIQASLKGSTKQHSISSERLRRRLEADYHHRSTPDKLEESQGEAGSPAFGETQPSTRISNKAQQESIQSTQPLHKDLGTTQQLHRIPKSNSDPNIPNIVVHSPTTDEEKDFSAALKKRHSLRGTGRSPTTYHSDPELPSPVKPIVTSTPAKPKRSKKVKRRDHKTEVGSDGEETKVNSGSDGHEPDRRKQRGHVRTTEGITPAPQQSAEQSEVNTDTKPIIRTASSRQGKRKKKAPVESKIAATDETDNISQKQKSIGAVAIADSMQRNLVEPSGWSQSSAAEAAASQGKLELLLVVRPGDVHDPTSVQTGIPLLRIPTVVERSQSSEVASQSYGTRQRSTKTEVASQTEQQRVTSSFSQTSQYSGIPSERGHVTRYSDQQGLTLSVPQTSHYPGIASVQGQVTVNSQQGLISQAQEYSGIPTEQGETNQTTHAVCVQTDSSSEPKPAVPFYPLLLQPQPPSRLQPPVTNATSNPQPPPSRGLPLLHLPTADPASKLDLSKMRLLEIPKRSGDTPLLHFPEARAATSQPAGPDLSKIKFLEIQPKKNVWDNTAEPNGPGIAGAPSQNWPLLRLMGSQSHSAGIDLSKIRLYENPPSVREAWPLLEIPKKTETPQLIPLEKILAFEKGIQGKLKPFTELPARYPHEKENIRPPVENKQTLFELRPKPATVSESKNKRNTASRQRRREALEKQTRPRSSSPLPKSRRGRATSRCKSSQENVITVQPAKKARKVKKVFPEKDQHESGHVTKKSRPNKPQTMHKTVSKKESEKSVSLTESELELSEVSNQVLDLSEEEEYFRVERSPGPVFLSDDDRHRPSKGKERGKERDHRGPSQAFEDVLPRPPSMQYIKERIGRKLHEVSEQMAAYRSGSNALDNAAGRQAGHDNARQTKTIGIQVDEEKQPSQVKSVGFFSSSTSGVGSGSTFKVSSSSQTDRPSARSPSERRHRELVTSGVQTEKRSVDSDHMTSHAPVLPPDIFLNLQMPKPDQDRGFPSEFVINYDQSVIDRPASIRERQVGVHIEGEPGVVPPERSTDVDQATSNVPMDVRGRQFLSVADIDHDQWLEVQSTPMTSADNAMSAQPEDESRNEEERRGSAGTEIDFSSRKESPKNDSNEDERSEKQENEKQFFEGADRVTVDMMDSTDVPFRRNYPLPFPTASQSSARAVSAHVLNERMKEMSERIEAMDQITQNMDREFKSSRVLLSAIQSIDEVLNPSSTERTSPGGFRRETPRRWGDTAPWRRGPKTSAQKQAPKQLHKAEDMEDSVDIDVNDAKKDVKGDMADVKDDEENEQSDIEDNEEPIATKEETDEDDVDKSFDQQQEDEAKESVETRSDIASDEGEQASDEEEKPESSTKTSVDKKDVHSSTPQDRERGAKPQTFDPLDSLTLTQDKLRDILHEKDTKRTRRDPSPGAREHLKEWMNKKRSERQAEWKNQKEELRAQEHQPFISPTQGSKSFKKMKLMEKERDAKRRKTEDQHKQKRIESASNLLSDMLTEPVPKPKDRRPNLRYGGGSVNSRYTKPLAGKKKRTGERNKKLPKGSLMGKDKPDQQVIGNETVLQQSLASARDSHSWPDGTYPATSLVSEGISARDPAKFNTRSQSTPRYDVIRTSSPVVSGDLGLGSLERENIGQDDQFVEKKRVPEDDFWRSKSPTGAEFVTTRTYRDFAKNQTKRLKARVATLRKTPPGGLSEYGLPSQPRGVAAMGQTYGRTRPAYPFLPGGETLAEVDRLLEDDDDGSSLDQEKLDGIESLLEGDEELKDLLSDVDWQSISKTRKADSSRPTAQRSKLYDGRQRERVDWPQKASRDKRSRTVEPAVPSSSVLSQDFDLDVSPWNTAQSLRTSDDVAQLLADVDEAVGNMSESTGSTRSHIDWEEVDKIMGEA